MPQPPTMMLAVDRLMASAMSLVRMPPEALTSMPAMMRPSRSGRSRPSRLPLFGFTIVLPIGGADMPVVISLLNSFTGSLSASFAAGTIGFVLAPDSHTALYGLVAVALHVEQPGAGEHYGAPETTPCSLPAAMSEPAK